MIEHDSDAASSEQQGSGEQQGSSEDSQKFFATHKRFTASNPTGAFDSPVTSFRLMPIPTRWPEIIGTVGVLYGIFIGLPAASGAWALWKILHGGFR
jgi:hypothetical protein